MVFVSYLKSNMSLLLYMSFFYAQFLPEASILQPIFFMFSFALILFLLPVHSIILHFLAIVFFSYIEYFFNSEPMTVPSFKQLSPNISNTIISGIILYVFVSFLNNIYVKEIISLAVFFLILRSNDIFSNILLIIIKNKEIGYTKNNFDKLDQSEIEDKINEKPLLRLSFFQKIQSNPTALHNAVIIAMGGLLTVVLFSLDYQHYKYSFISFFTVTITFAFSTLLVSYFIYVFIYFPIQIYREELGFDFEEWKFFLTPLLVILGFLGFICLFALGDMFTRHFFGIPIFLIMIIVMVIVMAFRPLIAVFKSAFFFFISAYHYFRLDMAKCVDRKYIEKQFKNLANSVYWQGKFITDLEQRIDKREVQKNNSDFSEELLSVCPKSSKEKISKELSLFL